MRGTFINTEKATNESMKTKTKMKQKRQKEKNNNTKHMPEKK